MWLRPYCPLKHDSGLWKCDEGTAMTTNDLATLVLNDMVSALNNWQLAKLKKTLETVFSQIDVITKKVDEAPCTSENEQFLRAFLAAKRVEGCSDRTVSYYESTLNKALSVIGKHASLITTDDLREYLHEYPPGTWGEQCHRRQRPSRSVDVLLVA